MNDIMQNVIDNFYHSLLYIAPSVLCAFWLIMFQILINTKSLVFKKEHPVDRYAINAAFSCVWIGLICSIVSPTSNITWDIYLVRYGMAILFTWGYFYHVKKFKT